MAKRDIVRQIVPVVELEPEQMACIAALLAGATDEAAGQVAGVSRATVQRWKGDDAFVATLNAARLELWEAHVERLRVLVGRAVEVLAGALESEDERVRVGAAWKLVQLGMRDVQPATEVTAQAVASKRQGQELFANLW